jgi:hypothetical protein
MREQIAEPSAHPPVRGSRVARSSIVLVAATVLVLAACGDLYPIGNGAALPGGNPNGAYQTGASSDVDGNADGGG